MFHISIFPGLALPIRVARPEKSRDSKRKCLKHQLLNRGSANPITGDVKDIVFSFVVGFSMDWFKGKFTGKPHT